MKLPECVENVDSTAVSNSRIHMALLAPQHGIMSSSLQELRQ